MAVHTYLRHLEANLDPLAGQRARAEAYRLAHLKEIAFVGEYVDVPADRIKPFTSRVAGKALYERVRPGDHVLLETPKAFTNRREALSMLKVLTGAGKEAIVHLLDLGIRTDTNAGKWGTWLLDRSVNMERCWNAERNAVRLARRRKNGRQAGRAPLGFRLVGPRGRRRCVPDLQERRVMQEIVRLHDEEHLDLMNIWRRLLYVGIKTRAKRDWSVERVQRAYEAELRLRQVNPA